MSNDDRYRPLAEDRWTAGMRIEPARFEVQTEWLYSDPSSRGRHPFSRSGSVVSSDVPASFEHEEAMADHLRRAVAEFGDDKRLVVEVRLAGEQEL